MVKLGKEVRLSPEIVEAFEHYETSIDSPEEYKALVEEAERFWEVFSKLKGKEQWI